MAIFSAASVHAALTSSAPRKRNDSARGRRSPYSFNIADFHEIHTKWVANSRIHAGIILAQQKRYSVGEQLRRLVHLIGSI